MQFDPANPLTVVQNAEEKRTEEEVLLEDDVFSSLRRKKKGVRVDLSDSEEEKVDQDDDMFESDEEERETSSKGAVETLDMTKFERELKKGDEGELPSLDHDEEEEDDDDDMFSDKEAEEDPEEEEEEEEDQPKMDSFNLKSDMDEGVFDAEGNFIRHAADEKDYQDAWLQGVSKKDIRKAREANRSQNAQNSNKKRPVESVKSLSLRLASVLTSPDQTPIQALKANAKSTQMVDFITELCTSLLIDHDITTIYDQAKSDIEALGGLTTHDTGAKKRKRSGKQYILKWSNDAQEHGPFEEATMAAWLDEGYFDSGEALCKPADSPDADFANPLDLSFD
ncbi:hypothetical protein TRVA0_004S01706 [Trichomonascus vanleenenianus]|uniref:GYF domain-containing protein n=1 Tax=Trichomonascus vanleenenianus TaxID=2268995 RepID=UPI003EC9B687